MVTESAFIRVAKIQEKIDVILTGGALVQLLSRGLFLTADVDLVLAYGESEEEASAALMKLGFTKKGAYWLDEEGEDIYQLMPERFLARHEEVRYRGKKIKVACVEFIIADRIHKCAGGERLMCEQALFLLKEFGKDVDRRYLRELLNEFGTDESFLSVPKLKRLVQAGHKKG
jgi:hypothetical protein